MSDFITDVERQYEMYCKIAEEHGFIDLNAKKNGFRCTTKSNEFNAGWIAFTGAVAAVRDEQQSKIDELTKQRDSFIKAYEIEIDKSVELQKRIDEALEDLEYPTAPWGETIGSVVKVLRGDA